MASRLHVSRVAEAARARLARALIESGLESNVSGAVAQLFFRELANVRF